MAKRRSKRSKAKRGGGGARKFVAHPNYGSKKYDCYGKRVKNARGDGTHPRVFCAAQK